MLAQGEQLQKVVAPLRQVWYQLVRQLPIGEKSLLRLFPGACVQLIDVDRVPGAAVTAEGRLLLPGFQVPQNRGRSRPQLRILGKGIAMVHGPAVLLVDSKFVQVSPLGLRYDALPKVPVVNPLHGSVLPAVKAANNRQPLGAGGKHPEHGPLPLKVRSQKSIGLPLLARVKFDKVHNAPPYKK